MPEEKKRRRHFIVASSAATFVVKHIFRRSGISFIKILSVYIISPMRGEEAGDITAGYL